MHEEFHLLRASGVQYSLNMTHYWHAFDAEKHLAHVMCSTTPQLLAASERSGRRLRDSEGSGRARISFSRNARAILVRDCGPALLEAQPVIGTAVRKWAAVKMRRPCCRVSHAKRPRFDAVDFDSDVVSSTSESSFWVVHGMQLFLAELWV